MLPGCGSTIELSLNSKPTAVVTSPNYPDNYEDGQECVYFIQVWTQKPMLC